MAIPLVLLAGGCIKHPVSTTGSVPTVSPSAAAPKPAPATAPAGSTPYGKTYREVPSVAVIGSPGADLLRQFTLEGDPAKVQLQVVPVTGQPFPEALRAQVKEAPPKAWDFQLLVKNSQPITRGDVLLATFYFRTEASPLESGDGQTEMVFELGRAPWTKSAAFTVRAGREWRRIDVPFEAAMTYPAGEAKLNFRLGFQPQTIDIAGVTLQSYGTTLPLSALPVTRPSYRGMEPDAKWRKAAAERIEKIRKGDMGIVVTDQAGQHMIGADIQVRQVAHAFGFGTCVSPKLLTSGASEQYPKVVTELFNTATLENNLKWVPLAGDWGPNFTIDVAKDGIAWLREHGIGVRGHVLVWPGWANLPRALKAHKDDPAYLRQAVDERIRGVMTAVKGTVIHWDVVNEPFDNHDLLDILGEKAMVDWFKLARATDPTPKLFINDFGILAGGGGDSPHRAHYEKTIKFLLDNKAPLDGIAIEGHFGNALTAPEEMLGILDRFAKFGKPIWITEYDNELADEEVAGKFTRDFYTTMFSHPAVEGVVMWGFWDGAHWRSSAPLYRRDWTLKPGGEAFRELVLKTWRTEAVGKTDADGRFGLRAFYGDYEINVSFAGRQKTVKLPFRPTPPSRPASLSSPQRPRSEIKIVLD